MTNILEEIYQHKILEVREAKKLLSLTAICDKIKCQNYIADYFYQKILTNQQNNKTNLICELKKGSPSKGIIRDNFNIKELTEQYNRGNASCISVLTDRKYFMGCNQYLEEARANSDLPILRKDFIVDKYQIYEAKMLGANAILLIVAMIKDLEKLKTLENYAINAGLSVLIEIHDENELEIALKMQSKLIGINNRNLKTMKVDINNTLRIAKLVTKGDIILISESGINNINDFTLLKRSGINNFLIGEYLMRQNNIIQSLEELNAIE
jgi:indole-3-glycerol phosphate synthase